MDARSVTSGLVCYIWLHSYIIYSGLAYNNMSAPGESTRFLRIDIYLSPTQKAWVAIRAS